MERILRHIKNGLAAVALCGATVGLAHVFIHDSSARMVDEPTFEGGKTVDLTTPGSTITVAEFAQRTDIMARLHEMAELDNVDKEQDCAAMSGMGKFLVTGFGDIKSGQANAAQKDAMLYNTWYLQQLVYCSSKTNGAARTTIKLPEGTFYFVSGHLYMANGSTNKERHVIKPHNNIVLTGVGTEINSKQTILKPYSETSEFTGIDGGLDMFFFNDYAAYGFPNNPNYLKDVHFSNFVIDSAETAGRVYNTSGKGFMINLFEDGTWYNITVQNTDATGFGVDCPIGNSWIDNSRAYGNGKGVWINGSTWNPVGVTRGGGSGFGIGTGYSDNERFEIRNSTAKGNGIFGFFYEHQGRFGSTQYRATTTAGSGFRVLNSVAEANTWNYGGLRSNNVYLYNVTSNVGTYQQSNGATVSTIRHVHFSDESRNITLSGVGLNGTAFSDVKSTEWYADAVLWAEANGIAGDTIQINSDNGNADNYATSRTFGVGVSASRADAVDMIWHMLGYKGTTLSERNGNVNGRLPYLPTCFDDVSVDRPYAAAISWAVDKGITNGVGGTCQKGTSGGAQFFNKDGTRYSTTVTRAEVVTMLFRLAGSPTVSPVEDFKDVKDETAWYYNSVQWAVQNKITNGVGDNTFAPTAVATREQVVAFLYRYWTQFICSEDCPNIDRLLDIHHNE